MSTDNHTSTEHTTGRRINLVPASSVRTERVEWLIEDWVPSGSLILLAGREGLGKSTIACGIAAQATRGELNAPPMNVAYLNTEDSRSMTVKPRLEAAGANMERVFFIDVTTDEGNRGALTLPGDTGLLARELAAAGVGLVILDAAKSAMHSSLDGYRDDDVRRFLEPLAAMCEEHNITVIGLVHFGKRESNDPGKLILGSVAWSQIARSVLSVAVDEDGTLVVTNTKGNLARGQVSREARIESTTIGTDDGRTTDVGLIVWGDKTRVSAADLLASRDDQDDDRDEISAVVLDYLASQGGSAPAGDVLKAARAAGLSDNAVKKARKRIGVKTEKSGMSGGWVWTIVTGAGFSPKVPEDSEGSRARTRESSPPSGESSPPEPSLYVSKIPETDEGPHARDVGTLGSSKVTGTNQDPDGARSQDPAHIGAPGSSPKPVAFSQPELSGDTELQGIVIGCFPAECPMSLQTVEQSVPPEHRDQVADILTQLVADGRVIQDVGGRYLRNSPPALVATGEVEDRGDVTSSPEAG